MLLSSRRRRRPDGVVTKEEGLEVVLLDQAADEQVLVHRGREARPGFVVEDLAVGDVACFLLDVGKDLN